jgi:TonB family protein
VLSDKDRRQQSPHPTIDKKTLQQLEAMRKAGPPHPAPQPARKPEPQRQIQQEAENQPELPAQPQPNNQQAKNEVPSAPEPKPHFSTNQGTIGQGLQDLVRGGRPRNSQYGGDLGSNAPSKHGGLDATPDIISDTMGVDFGPYLQRVIYDTKRAWYPIIPEAAQPPLNKQGRVAIRFKILSDGSVPEMHLEMPSGDVSLDRAAWGGITGASPYPPLPKDFKGKYLELRFYFLYNIEPGQQ